MDEQPRTDLPAAALSPHRPLTEFYPAAAARQNFVNELFDEAAPDYDWVSGMMSFGRDQILSPGCLAESRANARDAVAGRGERHGIDDQGRARAWSGSRAGDRR